ncbi:MAG: glycosyltransferase [Actinophytocola sp.]|nr:glycosyltransferase [Actinophytocola sp.]
MQAAPVVAVVVCHDGEAWLPTVLSALRRSTVRPQRVIAVDTGSTDRTPELLEYTRSEQDAIVDSILTMRADTGFAEAVAAGVQHASVTFEERHTWVWVLHDDSAPEPNCLTDLLHAADAAPSAGALGPLAVDWLDSRLIVEAGLSTDASGHRHDGMGIDAAELAEQSSEVLAMPSAGALISRELWDQLGGFDEEFPLLREDIDFGWRANVAGVTVLCVPRARIRHARALRSGERSVDAVSGIASDRAKTLAADRIGGVRTLLVNCSTPSFLLGVPRLVVLSVLRAIGFMLARDLARARAEMAAVGFMLRGGQVLPGRRLRAAERERADVGDGRTGRYRHRAGVRGLFVSRTTRLRFAIKAWVLALVRRRIASEAALGRLPESATTRATWIPPEELRAAAFAGGEPKDVVAVPLAGLRRSASARVRDEAVAAASGVAARGAVTDATAAAEATDVAEDVRAAETADGTTTAAARAPETEQPYRPSPGEGAHGGLVFVEVNRARVLAATLFAPPLLLVLGLTGLALLVNGHRLGLDLAGGRLLPVGELSQIWSTYLAGWHPEGGGTSAAASPALAIVGALGTLLYPIGGTSAAVGLVLLLDIPLAAISAYAASGRLGVHRWVCALLATGYALLPPATAAVAQGRIDVVVVHILLPLVLAGTAAVLQPRSGGQRWLSVAVAVSLGLAVIGSFSPLTHLMVLIVLLGGFVFVSSPVPLGRRLAGIALVALLPIALILPWPAALVTNPALLLHGLGARVPGLDVDVTELLSLYPGGAGTLPIGGVLVAAALVALVVRPTTRVLPGIGLVLIGAAGVAVVRLVPVAPVAGGDARPGWAGAPLLMVAAGLLTIVLAVVRRNVSSGSDGTNGGRAVFAMRFAVGAGVAALVVFAVASVTTAEEGPLRDAAPQRLAAPLAAELADSGRTVFVLRGDEQQPRISGGGMPAFGDDSLDLPDGAPERLASWQRTLLGGQDGGSDEVRDVLASVSAAGVQFVVLPDGVSPDALLAAGDDLVAETVPLADGRRVLRLLPTNGPVTLIAPSLSRLAISDKAPPGDVNGEGIAVVDEDLPDVRVRVSDGPAGRLLVLAANVEPGWQASVNGEQVPIVPAWGHQVGVEVPTRAADVVVRNQATVRTLLLLVQVGALLFTLLTAIPSRRPRV